MNFTLPFPPVLNRMYRSVVIGGHARVLLSKEARAYKTRIASICAGTKPLDGRVAMSVNLFRPRRAGDIDSTLKGLLDALQGYAYEKDSQLVELHVYLGDDKNDPRVEVSVWPSAQSMTG